MKKAWISVLLVAAMVMGFTGCAQKETALTPVRLNEVVHSIFYAPQYVAMELGYFEEEGLDITLNVGQGADKSMTALLSGSADIALLGMEAGIYIHQEGKENGAVPFAQLTQRAGNFLLAREEDPDFQWSDLKSHSIIGGRSGGMPQMILEYILKENGLDPEKDVDLITNLSFTSTASAFAAGEGDYTVEFEPVATTLEEQGTGHIVASLGEGSGYVPYTVYMTTPEYLAEHPDVVQGFTNAIYRAQLYIQSHSAEEIAALCQPYFEENSLETLTTIIDRYQSQDTWTKTPAFSQDAFDNIQTIMAESGELTAPLDFTTFIDQSFALKAVETITAE